VAHLAGEGPMFRLYVLEQDGGLGWIYIF
jgi:hypothetical protein